MVSLQVLVPSLSPGISGEIASCRSFVGYVQRADGIEDFRRFRIPDLCLRLTMIASL